MIGGSDLVLDGTPCDEDLDFLVRGIRALWPAAIVQPADSPAHTPARTLKFPLRGIRELLIYRDLGAFQSWQEEGATDENADTLLHVLASKRSVTLVVDTPDSALAIAARELLNGVQRNRVILHDHAA